MENINYSEALFESIDQIITERLKEVQYDRTIVCKVIEAKENEYKVQSENLILTAYSADSAKSYKVSDMVYVLIPNGDYEKTKLIIGGYSAKNAERKIYNNSYDNFLINDTIQLGGQIGLNVTNNNTPSSSSIIENGIMPYAPLAYQRPYDYIGLHWQIQTYQLFDNNIFQGDYSIELGFSQGTTPIVAYEISSTELYGNPYALSEESEQYNLLPYDSRINECDGIWARLIQKGNFTTNLSREETEDDTIYYPIQLINLELSFGYAKNMFETGLNLYLGNNQTLTYKSSDKLNEEISKNRNLYLDWRLIINEIPYIYNYINPKFEELFEIVNIYLLHYEENAGENQQFPGLENVFNWVTISSPDDKTLAYEIIIDTDYQTDQYKVLIEYKTIFDTQNQYITSNAIIFENLEKGIQINSSSSVTNLKLTLNDKNTGVYNVYGLDGRIVDHSKQGPYYITAEFLDALGDDKIASVEWDFPQHNTMIEQVDNQFDNQRIASYKIKNNYLSSATNNTVYCNITLTTKEIRSGSISFVFGEFGNSGTNYAFNLDFVEQTNLTPGMTEGILVKASLLNANGETVLLEDYENMLEWSWIFPDENSDKIITKEQKNNIILSHSGVSCVQPEDQPINYVKLIYTDAEMPDSNYSILQAKIKNYNILIDNEDVEKRVTTDLIAYLTIPITDNNINYNYIAGATRIVYDSLGTGTTYSTEEYKLFNSTHEQINNVIWELKPYNIGELGLPQLRVLGGRSTLRPASYVPDSIPEVCLVASVQGKKVWIEPILIIQNTWFNETINEWTNVFELNQGKDGSILSPLLIAGKKEANNQFTGLMVGQIDVGGSSRNTGVYGFNQGQARFWLNDKAEFFVGDSGNNQIYLDGQGNFSIVTKSFDLETTDQNLILSSTSGKFYISDGTNYLQFEKEIKDGETTTRNSIFKIKANEFEFDNAGYEDFDLRVSKTGFYVGTENEYISLEKEDGGTSRTLKISANNFEFNSTNYNGFSMRVGKEGFYTGTENEYISFEKQLKEDGSQDYYRTLRIQAKNFELETDYIILSSNEHYLLIRKSTEDNSDRVRAGYIRTEGSNKIYGLDIYGGALRVYTKESTTNPALWIQDSNIYIKGRITNQYATNPTTWMTMGNPDENSGEDRGPAFRMYYTTELTSASIFKIWPGYVDGDYHHIVISGYQGLGFSPYVQPNSGSGYSTYLDVTTTGGGMSEKWVLYSNHRFSGDVRTKNSLVICRSDDDYNTYDLHLWSDNSNNGVIDAPSGNLSLRSENSSFITGTNSGGTLHGVWEINTICVGNGYKMPKFRVDVTDVAYLSWRDSAYLGLTIDSGTGFAILRNNGDGTSSYKFLTNSSGGNLYGTWSAFYYGTVNGQTANWYSFKTHLNGGRLYGTWYEGNSSTAITSDRNLKNSIASLEEKYEILFDNLIPIKYKYNQGTSSRFHTGFIAQDVENAIALADLTAQDFAGLVFDTEEQSYYLRYDEFIALNTWQIQKLKTRVIELENEIKEIKQRYEI